MWAYSKKVLFQWSVEGDKTTQGKNLMGVVELTISRPSASNSALEQRGHRVSASRTGALSSKGSGAGEA